MPVGRERSHRKMVTPHSISHLLLALQQVGAQAPSRSPAHITQGKLTFKEQESHCIKSSLSSPHPPAAHQDMGIPKLT